MSTAEAKPSLDFVREAVAEDLRTGRFDGRVVTRFPPEPNGFLHIGHAKAICLDFGIAAAHGGACHLRFDDTNPMKEENRFVEAIKRDLRWLGFDWSEHEYFASDYYEQLYEYAVSLVRKGRAYVCDLGPDEIRAHRGPTPSGELSVSTPRPATRRRPRRRRRSATGPRPPQWTAPNHALASRVLLGVLGADRLCAGLHLCRLGVASGLA